MTLPPFAGSTRHMRRCQIPRPVQHTTATTRGLAHTIKPMMNPATPERRHTKLKKLNESVRPDTSAQLLLLLLLGIAHLLHKIGLLPPTNLSGDQSNRASRTTSAKRTRHGRREMLPIASGTPTTTLRTNRECQFHNYNIFAILTHLQTYTNRLLRAWSFHLDELAPIGHPELHDANTRLEQTAGWL